MKKKKDKIVFKRFKYRKEWYKNGLLHREDRPAVEWANGNKWWYKNGLLHRIEYANGDKYWYKNNKWHREDGPAIEYVNGKKFWYINDKEIYPYNNQKVRYIRKISRYSYIIFYQKATLIYKSLSKKPIIISSKLPKNIKQEKLKLYLSFI